MLVPFDRKSGEHRLPACHRRQLADESRKRMETINNISAGYRNRQASSLCSPNPQKPETRYGVGLGDASGFALAFDFFAAGFAFDAVFILGAAFGVAMVFFTSVFTSGAEFFRTLVSV